MKLCPRRPLKVPKDFGTRLHPEIRPLIPFFGDGKLYKVEYVESQCKEFLSYFDSLSLQRRREINAGDDKDYKPIQKPIVL